MLSRLIKLFFNITLPVLCLTSCESMKDYQASVSEAFSHRPSFMGSGVAKKKPGDYLVKRGDTLYSIAWANNLDHRTLAEINQLKPPYKIFAGQYLKTKVSLLHSLNLFFNKSKSSNQTRLATKQTPKSIRSVPNLVKKLASRKEEKGRYEIIKPQKKYTSTEYYAMPAISQKSTPVKGWKWPSNGKVVQGFSERAGGNKGIDLTGPHGSPVYAAASGKVVYKGSGLKGYGQLLLIKHNNSFLSAYAHNKRLLVQEGQPVIAGQKIAEMGRANQGIRLHFEIRKNGHPVDPMIYLNSKRSKG